jgi:hypothetical protein
VKSDFFVKHGLWKEEAAAIQDFCSYTAASASFAVLIFFAIK